MKKKILLGFICILLLVGCQDRSSVTYADGTTDYSYKEDLDATYHVSLTTAWKDDDRLESELNLQNALGYQLEYIEVIQDSSLNTLYLQIYKKSDTHYAYKSKVFMNTNPSTDRIDDDVTAKKLQEIINSNCTDGYELYKAHSYTGIYVLVFRKENAKETSDPIIDEEIIIKENKEIQE